MAGKGELVRDLQKPSSALDWLLVGFRLRWKEGRVQSAAKPRNQLSAERASRRAKHTLRPCIERMVAPWLLFGNPWVLRSV